MKNINKLWVGFTAAAGVVAAGIGLLYESVVVGDGWFAPLIYGTVVVIGIWALFGITSDIREVEE